MNALARRLAYRVRPRLRRETCKRCWRENPVGFSVPDDVWRAAVPARHIDHVLCLTCFDRYATARGVDWVKRGCEFYAVPGALLRPTSSSRQPFWTCTRCTARPLWAWRPARRSHSLASSSSSSRSAKCRSLYDGGRCSPWIPLLVEIVRRVARLTLHTDGPVRRWFLA